MSAQILWLDNDKALVKPYLNILRVEGYSAENVTTITEAEECLNKNHYDLFILDVMIPTLNSEEEKKFPPEKTQQGHRLGLCFYRYFKKKLDKEKTQVLVLTVRVDKIIHDEFIISGLPPDQFCTKYSLRHVEDFLKKVKSIIGTVQ